MLKHHILYIIFCLLSRLLYPVPSPTHLSLPHTASGRDPIRIPLPSRIIPDTVCPSTNIHLLRKTTPVPPHPIFSPKTQPPSRLSPTNPSPTRTSHQHSSPRSLPHLFASPFQGYLRPQLANPAVPSPSLPPLSSWLPSRARSHATFASATLPRVRMCIENLTPRHTTKEPLPTRPPTLPLRAQAVSGLTRWACRLWTRAILTWRALRQRSGGSGISLTPTGSFGGFIGGCATERVLHRSFETLHIDVRGIAIAYHTVDCSIPHTVWQLAN